MDINNLLRINRVLFLYKQGRFTDVKKLLQDIAKNDLNETDKKIIQFVSKKVDVNLRSITPEINTENHRPPGDIKFFIVIPSFNSEKYLEHTLKSILANSSDNSIVIHLQDGGSSDTTVDIFDNFFSKHKNKNIQASYSIENDSGMYDAINHGIKYLESQNSDFYNKSSVFTWLNTDDLLSPNALTTVRTIMLSNPYINWLTGIGSTVDQSGASLAIHDEVKAYKRDLILEGLYDGVNNPFIQQEGTFWRTGLFKKAGKLNAELKLAGDWELWKRFAQHETLIKANTIFASHRKHNAQLSIDQATYQDEISRLRRSEKKYNTQGKNQSLRAVFDSTQHKWNLITISENRNSNKHSFSEIDFPKISVVIPTFNQGKYIGETLQSIQDQKYPNLELIVIDGGSTDETLEIIDQYKNNIDYFISEKDQGQSDAINKGFKHATGDIYTWLNSDDQFLPDTLFSVGLEFSLNKVDMVIGICEVYQEGEIINRHLTSNEKSFPLKDILDLESGWNAGQFVYQPEAFFTADLWHRAGGHVKTDHYYSMDYELWARFSINNALIKVIGTSLINFRAHPEQKTSNPENFKKELLEVRRRFLADRNLVVPQNNRFSPDWSRRLSIAFVNDHGFQYGAGIAHKRIFAAAEMGKNNCENFELNNYIENKEINLSKFKEDILNFNPDVIIIGNLHSSKVSDLNVLKICDEITNTFWVTHDFWAITGRCAYMNGCPKYLTGCDSLCPTYNQYPQLRPEKIASSWQNKYSVLTKLKNTSFLANSEWAAKIYRETFHHHGIKAPVYNFTLGAPTEIFKTLNKEKCKIKFDVPIDKTIIGISVSSLSDKRKGAHILFEALSKLNNPERYSILVIGNTDIDIPNLKMEITKTGYITDERVLCEAYNAMDIYVGPSTEETFGQVYIEAALCGVPSIGLKGSGSESAIVPGITGWLLEASNSIPDLTEVLSDFTHIPYNRATIIKQHAANNFSLESLYHSLFNIFRKTGIVDKLKIANQISFKKSSVYTIRQHGDIDFLKGFSPPEGPFEEGPNFTFRWVEKPRARLSIYSKFEIATELELWIFNPIHNTQTIEIISNEDKKTYRFNMAKSKSPNKVKITIKLKKGNNIFDLFPSNMLDGSGDEKRNLSFAIEKLNIT